MFEEDLAGDAPRELMNLLLDKGAKVCAVFADNGQSFRYVIGSRAQDVRPLCRELNEALEGRGGGKPDMVQGTLAKGTKEEIKKLCKAFAEERRNE